MSGVVLLIVVVLFSFWGIWCWVVFLVYLLVFLVLLVFFGKEFFIVEMLVGGLFIIVVLVWLLLCDQSQQQELEWWCKVVDVLCIGFECFNEVCNDEVIICVGLNILVKLQVVFNFVFVVYCQGMLYVMVVQGVFNMFLNKLVYFSDNDSCLVQVDYWVVEEVFVLFSCVECQSYFVVEVYGCDFIYLGLLILVWFMLQFFFVEECGVVQLFVWLFGVQFGQECVNCNLCEVNDFILCLLGVVLECCDDEIGGYIVWVVGFVIWLVQCFGWDEEQVWVLCWGVYFYDFGKIVIFDWILYKNGVFDDQEKQVICLYIMVGYEML